MAHIQPSCSSLRCWMGLRALCRPCGKNIYLWTISTLCSKALLYSMKTGNDLATKFEAGLKYNILYRGDNVFGAVCLSVSRIIAPFLMGKGVALTKEESIKF